MRKWKLHFDFFFFLSSNVRCCINQNIDINSTIILLNIHDGSRVSHGGHAWRSILSDILETIKYIQPREFNKNGFKRKISYRS